MEQIRKCKLCEKEIKVKKVFGLFGKKHTTTCMSNEGVIVNETQWLCNSCWDAIKERVNWNQNDRIS